MQWIILAFWSLLMAICFHARRLLLLRMLMALGLITAMAGQLSLLWMDGLLTPETALPLHLCGLFGVLCVPFLFWHFGLLWECVAFLGAPAAFCALFFPAVIRCSHPLLMKLFFFQLHALIALILPFVFLTGKPLPTNARRTFILGSGYLLLIWLFNTIFGTNYLFLRSAPSGTPLEWLAGRGTLCYAVSLLMLCLPVFSCLQKLFGILNQKRTVFTAGNN